MYAAIDALADKLGRRVRKQKERDPRPPRARGAEARVRAGPLISRIDATDHRQRFVGLRQERGAPHARGPGLSTAWTTSPRRCSRPSSPTRCAPANPASGSPRSGSMRATDSRIATCRAGGELRRSGIDCESCSSRQRREAAPALRRDAPAPPVEPQRRRPAGGARAGTALLAPVAERRRPDDRHLAAAVHELRELIRERVVEREAGGLSLLFQSFALPARRARRRGLRLRCALAAQSVLGNGAARSTRVGTRRSRSS